MGNASTARKIGVAARVVTQQAGRTRLGAALWSGARAASSSFARVFHVLWLEVTGFVFFVLALLGGTAAFREYHKIGADPVNMNKVWAAGVLTLVFVYFGVTSFWRARKRRG